MGNVLEVLITSHETSASHGGRSTKSPIEWGTEERDALERSLVASLRDTLRRLKPQGEVSQAVATISSPWIISRFDLDLGALNDSSTVEHELVAREKVGGSVLQSAMGKDLVWRLENEFIRAAGAKRGLIFRSSLGSLYDSLNGGHDIEDSILINILHDATEILSLKDKVYSTALGFGLRHIVRAIAKEFGISEPVAESYLSSYIEGDFAQETQMRIDKALNMAEHDWRQRWGNRSEAGKVFLQAPKKFFKLMKAFIQGVLPQSKIVVYNQHHA